MNGSPSRPKVYHITHVNNLPSIVAAGGLWSDRHMVGNQHSVVGMGQIKNLRLTTLTVNCHPGTFVGDFVPFYFCPRSVMLYILFKQNHPGLTYRGGQAPIVHLEADLLSVVQWATANSRPWAFTAANAGAFYTQGHFYSSLAELHQVNWNAVASTDFRNSTVKEGKQAEFLVHESFPWHLVTRVGVQSIAVRSQAQVAIANAAHQPPVDVQQTWYF